VWNKRTDILRLLMKGAWLPTLRYEVEYPGLLLYGNDGTLERFNTVQLDYFFRQSIPFSDSSRKNE